MKQNWYKSWALWMSLAALVAYVVKSAWGKDIAPWLNGLMDVLLPVLVGFGIINNPNAADRWVLENEYPHIEIIDLAREDKPDADE